MKKNLSPTPINEKIKKQDIKNCKFIKNFLDNGKKINFEITLTNWVNNKISYEKLAIEGPSIENISVQSFKPTFHKDIPVGYWIQKLISSEKTSEPFSEKEKPYESTMKEAASMWKKDFPEDASGYGFIELAIKTIKQELK